MSKSLLRLHFLLLLLFCCVSPSTLLTIVYHIDDLVPCGPHQIEALTQFKNEFDSRNCNQTKYFNGVWCDNTTGAITELKLPIGCFTGILKPNSSLFRFHQLRFLDLSSNNFISSSLPFEFGNLNKLELLALSSNEFIGQVPSSFGNLSKLTILDLSSNKLTGSFPLLQNLTRLSNLVLRDNNFTGIVPSSLFTLPFLSDLDLFGNDFTGSIKVPASSRLESMDLGDNHFEGKILEPISKLISLKHLDLSHLNTSYPIDFKFFSSLKSLVHINLSGNNISTTSLKSDSYISVTLKELQLVQCNISEFPHFLKTLQKLEHIDLSKNIIKGKIPEWLWSLPRLISMDLQSNDFNGFEGSSESLVNSSVQVLGLIGNRLEGEFPRLPLSIIAISAAYNYFTGEIPLSICSRRYLDFLDLSYNFFTGPIPPCLSNLTILILRKNNLEGSIPDAFYVGASLQALNVGYNQLTGKLPRSLVNCSSLKFLSVDNNKIKDKFPFWLKASPNLQVLILTSNKFYGPISLPHQGPLAFPGLRIFEISGNKFTGSLPPDYFVSWTTPPPLSVNDDKTLYIIYSKYYDGRYYYVFVNVIDMRYKGLSMEQERVITSYAAIDLSGNLFEGQIPESIGLLKALVALNLSNNAFSGNIPPSLANLKELQSLDMSRNKLSGNIPNGLKSLSFLAFINVSHNQLKGEIPQGTQIIGQPISCFEGNAGLCGLPLEESCSRANSPPTQYHKKEEEEDDEEEQVLNWKGVVIGYGVGVLFGLIIAQVIASYKPEWLAKIIGLTKRNNR